MTFFPDMATTQKPFPSLPYSFSFHLCGSTFISCQKFFNSPINSNWLLLIFSLISFSVIGVHFSISNYFLIILVNIITDIPNYLRVLITIILQVKVVKKKKIIFFHFDKICKFVKYFYTEN